MGEKLHFWSISLSHVICLALLTKIRFSFSSPFSVPESYLPSSPLLSSSCSGLGASRRRRCRRVRSTARTSGQAHRRAAPSARYASGRGALCAVCCVLCSCNTRVWVGVGSSRIQVNQKLTHPVCDPTLPSISHRLAPRPPRWPLLSVSWPSNCHRCASDAPLSRHSRHRYLVQNSVYLSFSSDNLVLP